LSGEGKKGSSGEETILRDSKKLLEAGSIKKRVMERSQKASSLQKPSKYRLESKVGVAEKKPHL